jgi:hypothetical protein
MYVHDDRSRAFCAWRARVGGSLPLTVHGKAEIVNAICLAVFRHDITDQMCAGALADLYSDISEGRLLLADVPWRRTFERAEELSRTHTAQLGTRALDVLHVASAVVLGSRTLVTYDLRQAALGRAVGLRVVCPS